MKVWTFIFPPAEQPWSSIRVAAPDRVEAQMVAQMLTPQPVLTPSERPNRFADGSFMQYSGEIEGDARILRAVARDGRLLVAA